MRSLLARARIAIVLARLLAGAIVWALGFRAVSDDDFARVVIAQGFARSPSLDPSGTSWLPLPFWLTGSAMMLAGRELAVARATAVVLGVLASLLIFEAARKILGDVRSALGGALVATALPWSARLGVATVPELGAAACTLFAVASASPKLPASQRLLGAVALAAACLARYEPWFLVAPFAALAALDAIRGREIGRRERGVLALSAGVALAAPAAWIAWNRHAHGDALAFVGRVASYKRAIGGGTTTWLETLRGVATSMVTAEPELWLAVLALGVATQIGQVGALRVPAAWKRPILLLSIGVVCLVIAGARDGAPTHHPERALLAPILLAAVLAGAACRGAIGRIRSTPAGLAFGAVALAIVALGWFARNWWWPLGALGAREHEALVGRATAARTQPGEKVLVEVTDYGYFAVLAGSGRPEDFLADRPLDPRQATARSSFDDLVQVDARARQLDAVMVIGWRERLGGRCDPASLPGPLCWMRVPPAGRGLAAPAEDGPAPPAP